MLLSALLAFTLLLSGLALLLEQSAQARHAGTPAKAGLRGEEVARLVLARGGAGTVRVEIGPPELGGALRGRRGRLRLAPDVHAGRSMAAFGTAAHEAGHALQRSARYGALVLRDLAAPLSGLAAGAGGPLVVIGLAAGSPVLRDAGCVVFVAIVLLLLVALPVELDASRRAAAALSGSGYVHDAEEDRAVKSVLVAASLRPLGRVWSGPVLAVLWLVGRLRERVGGR